MTVPTPYTGASEQMRMAYEAADKYIDRLRDRLRGDPAPDLNECQRMYAHHKLQIHTHYPQSEASLGQAATSPNATLRQQKDALDDVDRACGLSFPS